MPNLASLIHFLPELILCTTAVVLVIFALIKSELAKKSSYIAIAGLVASAFFVLQQWDVGNPPLFWGLLNLDHPAVFFKFIFTTAAVLAIMFSQKSSELKFDYPEFYSLIIGAVIGMNLLAQASNLLMIYLALEFVSLTSYLLVGYVMGSRRSAEAALKYVLYGAVASGIFLYGASLYYGLAGTLDVRSFAVISPSHYLTISLASLFILAGFLYKIAAVPMHAWCPDAYEGAPTPVTAFLSVAPKAAGFAVLMRVTSVWGGSFNWPLILAIISAATMTFGNLAAIPQTNVKRLLAYSSIAHAGYLLMGIACATPRGNEAVYFYFIAYLIMNLGAFLVVQIVADKFGTENIETYKGLGRRGAYGTLLGVAMTIFLLSLIGVPPFIGFIGKFYIFSAVIEARLWWLAIIGIINSVISLYYYMRIVKAMFFDAAPEGAAIPPASRRLYVILCLLTAATLVFGLAWQPLANITSQIIS